MGVLKEYLDPGVRWAQIVKIRSLVDRTGWNGRRPRLILSERTGVRRGPVDLVSTHGRSSLYKAVHVTEVGEKTRKHRTSGLSLQDLSLS